MLHKTFSHISEMKLEHIAQENKVFAKENCTKIGKIQKKS